MKNLMKSTIAQIALMIIISITSLQAQKQNNININVLPVQKGIQLNYERVYSPKTSFTLHVSNKSAQKRGKNLTVGSGTVSERNGRIFFIPFFHSYDLDPRRVVYDYKSSVIGANMTRYSKAMIDAKFQSRLALRFGPELEYLRYKSIDFDFTEIKSVSNINTNDFITNLAFGGSTDTYEETRTAFDETKFLVNLNFGLGYQLMFNNSITLEFVSDFRIRTQQFRDKNNNKYDKDGIGHFNVVQMIPGLKFGVQF